MNAPTLGDVFAATQQSDASTAMEINSAHMGGNDYTTDDDHPEAVIGWAFAAALVWVVAIVWWVLS